MRGRAKRAPTATGRAWPIAPKSVLTQVQRSGPAAGKAWQADTAA